MTPIGAERLVAATLAQFAPLKEYDAWLYPTDPNRLSTAEHHHEAWRAWATEATAVIAQAGSVMADGASIAEFGSLREKLSETRAMLRMTPAVIRQRYEQAQRGEVYSLEEVRRELRAEHRR